MTDEASAPLANINVYAIRYNGNGWEQVGWTVTTDASGAYDIGGLAEGAYRVQFFDNRQPQEYASEYYDNAASLQSAADINVAAGGTTGNINAQLAKGAHIKGAVTDEAGALLANINVSAYRYNGSWWEQVGWTVTTDASGAYDIGGLAAGAYRVSFFDNRQPQEYVSEYYDNAASLQSAADITVAAGGTTGNINAQLAKMGHITGTVTDEAGAPLANINVYAIRYNGNGWEQVGWTVTTDAAGAYDVGGLAEGAYRVQFFDNRQPQEYVSEYYDNAASLQSAADINVAAGGTTGNINAQLAKGAHIKGTVTDEASAPLANINVYAIRYNGNGWEQVGWTVTTDASGAYDIGGLAAGAYRVQFFDNRQPQEYVSEYYDNAASLQSAADINVAAGGTTGNINAQLAKGAHIKGAVTDEAGAPLANINVSAYRYNGSWWEPVPGVTTDAAGAYDIGGLAAGTYRVQFSDHWPQEYVSEYYDNAASLESAADITVAAGGTTGNINAQLAKGAHIRGTVTDEAGAPLANIYVSAYRYSGSSWAQIGGATTDASGAYDVGGLAGGTYRVQFFDNRSPREYVSEYYDNAASLESAADITVPAGGTTGNINAQLAKGAHIRGTVTDEAGTPLANINVSAYRYNGSWWAQIGWAMTDAAGAYDVGGLAGGTYRVQFFDNRSPREYVSEYYDNAASLESAADITVPAGGTTGNINAQLAKGAHIRGTVTDEAGAPLANINVYAIRYNGNGSEPVGWAMTDASGAYDVGGLAGGTYRVQFFENRQPQEYVPEYYDNAASLESAADITVAAGGTTGNINAQLAKGAHIRGTVTDEAGAPLANINVSAHRYGGNGWGQVGWAMTDASGAYDVGGLAGGTYRVQFFDNRSPREYVSEYYDNAASLESAANITVPAGGTTGSINAQLAKGAHIRGTVTDEAGAPLANINVSAYRYNGSWWEPVGGVTTDAAGAYDIGGLAAGTYRVQFFDNRSPQEYLPEYYDNAASLESAADITVAAGGTTGNINAQLAKGAHIKGTVTDEAGAPLANIYVSAYRYSGSSWAQIGGATTDASGAYDVGGLAGGTYRVQFSTYWPQEYLPEYYDNAATLESAADITVPAGGTTGNINAQLAKAAHIRGTVTDEAGAPLANINVSAHRYNGSWWEQVGWTVTTDASGAYDVGGLAGGTYRVQFSTYWPQEYLPEYYDNAASLESAADITVPAGGTTGNINAQLAKAAHIRGTVTDEAGAPLANINVSAHRYNGSWWEPVGGVTTDASGAYDVGGLAGGTYRVQFSTYWPQEYLPEYYDNAASLESAADITVAAGGTTGNINAQLAKAAHIRGTVTDEAGAPLANINVSAHRYNGSWWEPVGGVTTDASGAYDVGGLAGGTYRVQFSTYWPQEYLPEYYDNAATLESASDISVTWGSTIDNIDAILQQAYRLSGRVEDAGGNPVANVDVRLYRQSANGWAWLYSSSTDGSGNYVLHVLEPGTYRVGFYDRSGTFAPQFYSNANNIDSAVDIPVSGGGEYSSINATLLGAAHVTGMVTASDGNPLAGIEVTAYRNSGEWVGQTFTEGLGRSDIGGLGTDSYRLYFRDPTNNHAYEYFDDAGTLASATGIATVSGSTVANINAILSPPTPPAVEVQTATGSVSSDPRTGEVTVSMTWGQRADVTIMRTVTCPSGISPESILLMMEINGSTKTYTMIQSAADSNQYEATIPQADITSSATMTVHSDCGGTIAEQEVGTIRLYDPSGNVTDADTGEAIAGATITLFHVPGWRPRTSPTDLEPWTCESGNSKDVASPWTQSAPLGEGVIAEPTSGNIFPAANPLLTDAQGHYGWDVAEGCWYVKVSAAGYHDKISPVVGVPPAVIDLNIVLSALDVVDVPVAGLSANNNGPTPLGTATTFQAAVTTGTNVVFAWDFGDGGTAAGNTVSHTYAAPGSYTAKVTASNGQGTQNATTVVQVVDVPVAGLSANNNGPTPLGTATTFQAAVTTGTNVVFAWDFGDGGTAAGNTVSHTYAAPGSYTAKVTASNGQGTQNATTVVQVVDVPVAGLSANNNGPTPLGTATTFQAAVTTGTNVVFAWDFGDGGTAAGNTVSHTYAAPGSYTAKVTASNGQGTQNATTVVQVVGQQEYLYLPLLQHAATVIKTVR